MAKVRVENFTITVDGFSAGVNQRMDAPFGDGVDGLHDWMFAAQDDKAAGRGGIDASYIGRYDDTTGATIMGRNMFGPFRGPWEDESWQGWWGDNPPYHRDTFVLTHHPRPTLPMKGGTTFYFTDDPIEQVLERALTAANGKDVTIGGGAATVQQYLRAGLIDELHVVVSPILAGAGERLFDNLADGLGNYRVDSVVSSPKATHVQIVRR
ncbi:dihydrofolate reductase family protein [Kribbella sp. NPDC026611]|uniref:dihydrofolate reductase family protein n=1 Tax=Kribbella sp. NPDC026611 TaxID=3154911 RepID=UPI0033D02140